MSELERLRKDGEVVWDLVPLAEEGRMSELERLREEYEESTVLAYYSPEKVPRAKADALIAALEAELASPWHIGRFIEVDGITVGPHKAREWLRRIRELEAELAALRADRTEILDSAWNTAHKRAETAEAVRREERDKRVLAEERQRVAEAELEATIESFSAENRELQKRRHSVEAEATEVERILELAWEDQTTNPRRFPDGMPKYRHWLADLKARAQEPSA